MTKASENEYPKITVAESAAPGTPTAGLGYVYQGVDKKLYLVDDTGASTDLSAAAGAVSTDAIWDAKGDLAVGTASNAATRLAVGTDGYVLTADSTAATGLKWDVASGGLADMGEFTYLDGGGTATPGTPAAGYARLYAKNGRIYSLASDGTEYGPFDAAGTATTAEPGFDIFGTYPNMSCGVRAFSVHTTWPSANLAIYVPIVVPAAVTVKRAWYMTGGTTTGDANVDIGIYGTDKVLKVSTGSTAWNKNNNTTFSTIDLADTSLDAGLYYVAMACGTAVSGVQFPTYNAGDSGLAAHGILQQTSALPLPGTAGWAYPTTLQYLPMFGILCRSEVT